MPVSVLLTQARANVANLYDMYIRYVTHLFNGTQHAMNVATPTIKETFSFWQRFNLTRHPHRPHNRAGFDIGAQ